MASIISAGTTSGTALNMTGDTSGQLQLATGASATTAVTIDTSQNVGIGLTSPTNRLDAYDTSAKAAILAHGYSVIGANANTNNGCIQVGANGSASLRLDYDSVTGGTGTAAIYNTYSGGLTFGTNNTERMRIDSSGNVLVGTTAAIGLLTIQVGNGGNSFSTKNSSGTAAYNAATFYNNGGSSLVGYIQPSGTSTAYSTSSDYRLKENVLPMVGALNTVAQLKPVTYDWVSDKSKGQGFIAHELQAVVPDCVTGEKDAVDADGKPVYQGVDTSFLVATLTAAIQEQQTIINDLKARIETLESK